MRRASGAADERLPPGPAELPRPKEKPEALVLRGRPRPAVRFRRGLIVGLTGAVTATLIGLSWFALEPPSFRTVAAAADSDEAARKAPPDALANVPGSYGEVPRLGPPLPAIWAVRSSSSSGASRPRSRQPVLRRRRRAASRRTVP